MVPDGRPAVPAVLAAALGSLLATLALPAADALALGDGSVRMRVEIHGV